MDFGRPPFRTFLNVHIQQEHNQPTRRARSRTKTYPAPCTYYSFVPMQAFSFCVSTRLLRHSHSNSTNKSYETLSSAKMDCRVLVVDVDARRFGLSGPLRFTITTAPYTTIHARRLDGFDNHTAEPGNFSPSFSSVHRAFNSPKTWPTSAEKESTAVSRSISADRSLVSRDLA